MNEPSLKESKSKQFEREIISIKDLWMPTNIEDVSNIPKGDMPGDKIKIGDDHIKKAQVILPKLMDMLIPLLNGHPKQRAVIAVCGGSGVGKSETASLLSYCLNKMNIGSYTLSGDNYPHRIPKYNDAERLRIFRQSGIKGLICHGEYIDNRHEILMELQKDDQDANPEYISKYPWLSIYQQAGKNGLKSYLGTSNEINFTEISDIICQFKNGAETIFLKRMGREETDLWYEEVDFTNKRVMIIEWTHSNNDNLQGVDIPILLNSTPQETLEHRKARNRDGAIDSPFTSMVLSIEQDLLVSQASKAKLIVAKNGDILSYNDFIKVMTSDR